MKRIFLLFIVFLLLLCCGAAIYAYRQIGSANTAFEEPSKLLFVPTSFSMPELLERLSNSGYIASTTSFELVRQLKKFETPKPGRYRIKKGMSNNELVNLLRSGNQESVLVRLDDLRTAEQLAGRLARQTEVDSTSYINYFMRDEVLAPNGLLPATFVSLIIADSYDFFWTLTPQEFVARMKKIHDDYWTPEQHQSAADLGLSPQEVYTLASIVKGETAQLDEAPQIAGLYLNRLKTGMRLESDPTVVFSSGNFATQRVLYADLNHASPYNTYKNDGLPPGPISLVEKEYLNAVLSPAKHNFLFMCAEPGGTGKHSFAVSYEQHLENARVYRAWLDQQQIRR
jgi:UPF0755 protein